MRASKRKVRAPELWLGVCLLGAAPAVAAYDVVGMGRIVGLENGWFGEGVALQHNGTGLAGCDHGPGEFAISKDHPAYKELTAIALAAYSSASNVELVVERGVCHMGRTAVIAIRLKQ